MCTLFFGMLWPRSGTLAGTPQAQRNTARSAGCEVRLVIHDSDTVAVIRTMRTLPPDTRRVFTLRKVYGLSSEAIGMRLSMTLPEVERHLVIAVLACAQALDPTPRPPASPLQE